MFFSVGKLFWLAVVLWGVWTVFRMIEKRQKRGKEQVKDGQTSSQHKAENAGADDVDMRECPTCKSWVKNSGCNHPDCPIKQS